VPRQIIAVHCWSVHAELELHELMCSCATNAADVGYLLVYVSLELYLKCSLHYWIVCFICGTYTLSKYISVNYGHDGMLSVPWFSV